MPDVDFEDVVLDVEEQTEETQEETAQTEQQTAPPQAEEEGEKVEDTKPTETPRVKLKYNHEEKEYSLDEVIPLAQKGMNYDKLQEKVNSLENDPRLTKAERLNQLASLLDMDDDALIDTLFDNVAQDIAQQENITQEQAREKINKKFDLDKREKLVAQKEKELSQKEQREKEYIQFLNDYPEVKAEDIPADVFTIAAKEGKSLSDAYAKWENNKLKEQIKTLKQNEENQKKAPVSGTTQYGDGKTEAIDPFLEGFNTDY